MFVLKAEATCDPLDAQSRDVGATATLICILLGLKHAMPRVRCRMSQQRQE